MLGYLAYKGTKGGTKSMVKSPGAIITLIIFFFQVCVWTLALVAQILIWIFLAFDWTLRKTSTKYCHWRITHQLPSEKDPDHPHFI